MNRRGEWGQNLPPKLEVVDPDEEFQPQEEKKTKRKSKNQSPTSREDPINQQTKRQKVGTMNTDENDKEQNGTRARAKAKPDLSTFGGYEEGGAMEPLSWDALRSQEKNTSILQFFVKQNNPVTTNFGENSGISGVNGGQGGDEGSG